MSERKKAIILLSSATENSAYRILYSAVTVRKFHSERDYAVFAFVEDEKIAGLLSKIHVKVLQTGEMFAFEQCNFNGSKNLDEMNFFFAHHEFDAVFLKENTFAEQNFSDLFKILLRREFVLYENKGNFAQPEKKHQRCVQHLVKKGVAVYDDTFVKVPIQTALWSSEVIGIPYLGKNTVEKTKKMACRLSRKIKDEVFEPSISFMLGEHGKISPAKNYAGNYADFPEFDEVLKDFASRITTADAKEIFRLAEQIDVRILREPKLNFLAKNYFERTWLKMNKKHWTKPLYSFD